MKLTFRLFRNGDQMAAYEVFLPMEIFFYILNHRDITALLNNYVETPMLQLRLHGFSSAVLPSKADSVSHKLIGIHTPAFHHGFGYASEISITHVILLGSSWTNLLYDENCVAVTLGLLHNIVYQILLVSISCTTKPMTAPPTL